MKVELHNSEICAVNFSLALGVNLLLLSVSTDCTVYMESRRNRRLIRKQNMKMMIVSEALCEKKMKKRTNTSNLVSLNSIYCNLIY